jgi:hypothetical protein
MDWAYGCSGMLGTLAAKAIIEKLAALPRKIKNKHWLRRYRASGQFFRLDDDREMLLRLPAIGDDDWRREVQLMLEITRLSRKVETPKKGVLSLRDLPAIRGVLG